MRRGTVICMMLVVLVAAIILIVSSVVAVEPESPAAVAEEYAQAAMPGPEHEILAGLVGRWKHDVTLWLQPGAPPLSVSGIAESEMILGGRFLKTTGLVGTGPMETESLVITGFDRRSGEFTQIGFDTWGTYYVEARGAWDETARTITFTGRDYDPIGDFTQEYTILMALVDDSTFTTELIFTDSVMTQGKGAFKMVESTFTRIE